MPLTKARLRISDYNQSRKGKLKETESKVAQASLSLTSMIDMFAVLVVYLIINTTSLKEWVDLSNNIELPKGRQIGETPPRGATLQVNPTMVLGGLKEELVSVQQVDRGPFSVPQIKEFLKKQQNVNSYVNIVADYQVSFGVMRKIIASCQDAGFKNVNLAIQPIN